MKARRREPRWRKVPLRCVERPMKRMHPRIEVLRLKRCRRLSSLYEILLDILDEQKIMAALVTLIKTTHLYDKIQKENMKHLAKERNGRKRRRDEGMQVRLGRLRKDRERGLSPPPLKTARNEDTEDWLPEDIEMMSVGSAPQDSQPQVFGEDSQPQVFGDDISTGSEPFTDVEEGHNEEEEDHSGGSLDTTYSTAVEELEDPQEGTSEQHLPPVVLQDRSSLLKIASKVWQGILWFLEKVAQKLQSAYQKWTNVVEKKQAPVQAEHPGTSQDPSIHQSCFPPCYLQKRCSRYQPYNRPTRCAVSSKAV